MIEIVNHINTEGVFRLVMSIPSPKAESFKVWLAQIGRQHVEEIENPELLTERQAEIYRAKGYPEEWVQRRIQSIDTRKALTEEWKKWGVKEGQEYSILTLNSHIFMQKYNLMFRSKSR